MVGSPGGAGRRARSCHRPTTAATTDARCSPGTSRVSEQEAQEGVRVRAALDQEVEGKGHRVQPGRAAAGPGPVQQDGLVVADQDVVGPRVPVHQAVAGRDLARQVLAVEHLGQPVEQLAGHALRVGLDQVPGVQLVRRLGERGQLPRRPGRADRLERRHDPRHVRLGPRHSRSPAIDVLQDQRDPDPVVVRREQAGVRHRRRQQLEGPDLGPVEVRGVRVEGRAARP